MFIDRKEGGSIESAFASRQYDGQEEVADSAPELVAFLDSIASPKTAQVPAAQLVRALAQALGKTDKEIDDIFTVAASLGDANVR